MIGSQWPVDVVGGNVVERKTMTLSRETGDISIRRRQAALEESGPLSREIAK